MRRLKEKIDVLNTRCEKVINENIGLHVRLNNLVQVNIQLEKQARKVGPLIAESVKLANKLEDLENQIEQEVEKLS